VRTYREDSAELNRRKFCAMLASAVAAGAIEAFADEPQSSFGISGGQPVLDPPRIVGPIPVSATSTPYASVMEPGSYTASLMRQYDYVEEEYFLFGHANIYGPGIKTGQDNDTAAVERMRPLAGLVEPRMPYATRLLVARPRDNGKFSGRVIAYAFHNLTTNMMVEPNFLRNGDAVLGVEGNSGARYTTAERPTGAMAQLHKYDLERYRDLYLSPADPLVWPDLRPGQLSGVYAQHGFSALVPDVASGVFAQEMHRSYAQAPDIVTQVAHALKLNNPALPFDGRVKRLFNYAASGGTMFLRPYIDFHHGAAVLPDGRPVYDGYYVNVGVLPQTRPQGAVLAFMESEADLTTNILMKRDSPPDTDSPAFRMYQIPGTGHLLSAPLDEGLRLSADRGELPPGISPYDKMNKPIVWGLWQNMYDWIEHGRPMPHAQHIALDPSTPDGIARDKYGNALGGLRTPWVDVPDGTYVGRVSAAAPLRSGIRRFSDEQMTKLYGSRARYLRLVNHKIDELVQGRWIMSQDAAMMRLRA
jgi:hypothetical protein